MEISGERMWENEKQRIITVGSDILKLEPELLEELTMFRTEYGFFIRITRDNGIPEHITGWRVQHCNPYDTGRKPYRGGFMRASNVGRDLLRTKASLVTWKCAIVGPTEEERVPCGGAKGGLRCNPQEYSDAETKQQMEQTAKVLNPIIGPTRDCIGPDFAVGPKEIRYFVTTYSELNKDKGIPCGAIATNKPLEHGGGGCPGRLKAPGQGIHFVFKELKRLHPALKSLPPRPRAIVEGFGQVGSSYCLFANNFDIEIVGVSDINGGIYNPDGILIEDLLLYQIQKGTVVGYPDADPISNHELLLKECEIIVPAATENTITPLIAENLHDSVITVLEGANAPTLPEAELILRRRQKLRIPDILANAGGITVSYFEWCQDTQGKFWTELQINNELERYMIGGARRTFRAAEKFGVDLGTAAYIVAISYCAPALRDKHGWKKSNRSLV